MEKGEKYQILNSDDFKQIAEETGYQKGYVRQVLRGNSGETKLNQKSFDSADKTIDLKIIEIRKQ